MHKRVSSGERHTSSGDNNARKIIGHIIIDRSISLQAYVKKAKFWVDSWQSCLKTPKKITD